MTEILLDTCIFLGNNKKILKLIIRLIILIKYNNSGSEKIRL